MKQFVVNLLHRMPVLLIIVIEAAMVYTATSVAKVAFSQLDPLYAVWYRVGFMTLLLLAWRRPFSHTKRSFLPKTLREWAVVAVGISLVAMNTMFYVAISCMPVGVAVTIEFIGPLLVAVITGHEWRERVGMLIAVCGIIVLASTSMHSAVSPHFLIGLCAILVGGSMWGVYIVSGRMIAKSSHAIDRVSIAALIGWLLQSTVLAVPAVQHVISPKPEATWAARPGGSFALLALMLVIAVCASFFPALLDQVLLKRVSSAKYSVMQALYPAIAVVIGMGFGEIPTWTDIVGIVLVMCAVVVTFSGDHNPV
ncbi:EamA family transporter [Gardnerella sp. KA00747]|uniref:EamA family transporter n=1 Tax=Gardnerella sp. KA00747 TaxID=2749078 RepID=UPI003BAC6C37